MYRLAWTATPDLYDHKRPLGPWPPLWMSWGPGHPPFISYDYDVVFERCRRTGADHPHSWFTVQSWLIEDWKTTEPVSPVIHLHFATVPLPIDLRAITVPLLP